MENPAVPEKKEADEAVLQAQLDNNQHASKTTRTDSAAFSKSGMAAMDEILAKANQKIAKKTTIPQGAVASTEPSDADINADLNTDIKTGVASRQSQRGDTSELRKTRAEKQAATFKAEMLIAHADTTQLSVLEMSFISEGYNVIIFDNGKEALRYLKTNEPDIMLLDATMPKLTGMDICFRIRKIKRFEDVPVIIMTEGHDDKTETMIKMCHANDFFPKTSKNIELKAKVRKLLENDNSEASDSE